MQIAVRPRAFVGMRVSFDWALVVASCWFVAGLLLDGWAHGHLDLQADGIFTPFHAVLYSGFLAIVAVTAATVAVRRRATGSWRAAIPAGHGATLAGIGVFAAGGVLDLVWHTVFGIEQDVQAILSPTHLLLALGVGLIVLGPFRSVRSLAGARGWRAYAPAIASFALLLTLVEFFTQWAIWLGVSKPMNPAVLYPQLPALRIGDIQYVRLTHDMLAVVMFGALYAGTAVFLARRLPVGFGAVTAIFGFAAVMMSLTVGATPVFAALLIVPSLLAGVATDALRTLRAFDRAPRARLLAIGAAVPLCYWGSYFTIVASTGGSWWQIHSLAGAPFLGVIAGVMLALFQETPRAEA